MTNYVDSRLNLIVRELEGIKDQLADIKALLSAAEPVTHLDTVEYSFNNIQGRRVEASAALSLSAAAARTMASRDQVDPHVD